MSTASEPLCRQANEEYDEDPFRSQNTCENYGCYNYPQCPGRSITGDQSKCYCKKGFARFFTKDGPCIAIVNHLCAPKLPITPDVCRKRGEGYKETLGYRSCENTCENYDYNCGTIQTIVITWKPWCDCDEDQARLPTGKCVPVGQPDCVKLYQPSVANCRRRGEEVYRIGQICEKIPSCQFPNGPPVQCHAVGKVPKCYCSTGKLRNKSGRCVPKNEC